MVVCKPGDEFIEVVVMSDSDVEKQLLLANTELNRRIELLEETLLEKATLPEKERTAAALQDSEKRYRRLFESAKDGILILDADTGKVVDVNPFLLQLLGYSYNAICGQYIWELGVFKDVAASKDAFKTLQDNEYIRYDDLPLETLDGRPIAVEFVSNVYLVDHSKVIQCNIRNITERKRAEAERKRLMTAIEQVGEAIVITDAQGIIQFINPAFERTTGYSREEAVGQNPSILKSDKQDELFYRNLWDTISAGRTWVGRIVNKRKDGTLYTEETTISPVRNTSGQIVNYVAVKRDLTEHLRLTSQFQQAQKMESVGLLAGGVAHDFNNLLTVINGESELLLNDLAQDDPRRATVEQIIQAGNRAASLTSQLLAFSRKQILRPKILDLNDVVGEESKMLHRLIGEDIDLISVLQPDLGLVNVDPGQIQQIIMNLAVNARDAMPNGGKLTIETANVENVDDQVRKNATGSAGPYVMLAISDNGIGMDAETQAHMFEPFFTTKGPGKGTGLGLSTVYGIVKQSSGFIWTYSELGEGTTFKIYFPRVAGKAYKFADRSKREVGLRGVETILLVEDDSLVRAFAARALRGQGYSVLEASNGREALQTAKEFVEEIHLILTDVVMPEMSGNELFSQIKAVRTGIKALFVSGYTSDAMVHHGTLDSSVSFLQKPFTADDLVQKVREVIDSTGDRSG